MVLLFLAPKSIKKTRCGKLELLNEGITKGNMTYCFTPKIYPNSTIILEVKENGTWVKLKDKTHTAWTDSDDRHCLTFLDGWLDNQKLRLRFKSEMEKGTCYKKFTVNQQGK